MRDGAIAFINILKSSLCVSQWSNVGHGGGGGGILKFILTYFKYY